MKRENVLPLFFKEIGTNRNHCNEKITKYNKGKNVLKTVTIKDKEYTFISDYFDSPELFKSFNVLARKTFDFELEEWDDEDYFCYSLLDGDIMVANVSVQRIDFEYEGKTTRAVQVLTVMTDESYRKQGLSAFLMNRMIEECESQYDLLYLFANDTAVDFYPRFGFEKESEFLHFSEQLPTPKNMGPIKLDVTNDEQWNLIKAAISQGFACTSFPALNAVGLIEWLCKEVYKDQLYHIQKLDAVVIARNDEKKLRLNAVFGEKAIALPDVIAAMIDEETERVELGFTPKENEQFSTKLLEIDDSTLFVRSKHRWGDLGERRLPLLTRT